MSEKVLEVAGLNKTYEKFALRDVSFAVERGSIMGFIGRNGAGKTTTMKSILNLVHPDSGEIRYFGLELRANEAAIKRRIGFAGGAVDYYRRRRISDLLAVTRTFYDNWDAAACEKYLSAFALDPGKTVAQLSEGMRVKLNLTMALSHRAELLILDEPTSGLDPVSREELLDIFRLLRDRGVSILFSTHITSDLDKCADAITYIREGRVLATGAMDAWLETCRARGIGGSLEDIMLHYEKEALHERLA